MEYLFEYDLEKGIKINGDNDNLRAIFYGVRYYQSDNGMMVEIGDGYRHEIFLKAEYWNIILDIIKNDKSGEITEAIVKGLMRSAIHDEFIPNFISAIKDGKIKEIKKELFLNGKYA
ncbi:MAG: hypothetical protein AABX11_02200 [Nanoarchaeota archaeon]